MECRTWDKGSFLEETLAEEIQEDTQKNFGTKKPIVLLRREHLRFVDLINTQGCILDDLQNHQRRENKFQKETNQLEEDSEEIY